MGACRGLDSWLSYGDRRSTAIRAVRGMSGVTLEISELVGQTLRETIESSGAQLVAGFGADSELLKCGLDSLGFALLVVRLEEILGYDPFVLSERPMYPRTYGEFVAIYERFADRRKA